MNFDFSDDQKMLKDQAAKFLGDKCKPENVRRILESDEPYDKALWKGLADMGFLGTTIPEAYGGLGLGYLELCVIAEELGRACAPVPLSSSVYLASEAINRFGSEEQKQAWLPKVASGDAIGCFAFAEGVQAPNGRTISTTLSGGKLSGTKLPVADGDVADFAVVVVKTGSGTSEGDLSLALVDLTGAGIKRESVSTIDPTRSHATITFDGAAAELVGKEGDGWANTQEVMNCAAVLIAFEQLGGTQAALEMAKDYALERYAFGRQIGSYQAIKHKLADMYVKLELARGHCYYGAWALSTNSPELPLAAAGARVAATEAYRFAAQENIQTHGGIGYTWEANTQFYYRRSKLLGLALGAPGQWKERIVRQLEQRNAA
ncbi:acyl-CoA dehydrogenase family protein [Pyruvatibacter sp.]|uniref:acyl-CoA dehydrogenase family protein n=1 Tax=Pyruvatibacter sp. TaxID=1981328 RepID=UPI0032EB6B2D